MKLFVAYHYHKEDKWIKDLIIPLIKDLDITIISGEDSFGNILVKEVPDRIKKCDCMIAFVTKSWIEHSWVRSELTTALAIDIPALEIREMSIKVPDDISDGRGRLDFDLNKKEELIRDLVPILYRWKKEHDTRNLLILPENIMQEAGKHILEGFARFTYQFKDGDNESKVFPAKFYPVANSIVIDIKNIPSPNALIKINMEGPGFRWYCGYQTFSMVKLEKIKHDS